MKKILALTLIMIFLVISVSAQMADEAELRQLSSGNSLGISPMSNPFSLLDFSRIKWSHSYSVSFLSGGYGSGTQGMFTTNMFYEISSKLSLNLNLGIAHGGGVFNYDDQGAVFLPGFALDYHPSEKFRMTFMVQTYRGNTNPYLYDRSRYWLEPVGP